MLEYQLEEAERRERSNNIHQRDSTRQLNVRLHGLERKLETANRKLAARDEKIKSLRKDVISELEIKWKKNIDASKDKVKEATKKIADLGKENARLKKEYDSNLKEANEKASACRTDLALIKMQLAEKNREIATLSAENRGHKKTIAKNDTDKKKALATIAQARLRQMEIMLERKKIDMLSKERDRINREKIMHKRNELRAQAKADDQLIKDQSLARVLRDRYGRVKEFAEMFGGKQPKNPTTTTTPLGQFPKLNQKLDLLDPMIQGTLETLQAEVAKANDQLMASQKAAGSMCFEVTGTDDPDEPIIQMRKKAKTSSSSVPAAKVPPTPAKDQHTLTQSTGLGFVTPAGKKEGRKWTPKHDEASDINYWEDGNGNIELEKPGGAPTVDDAADIAEVTEAMEQASKKEYVFDPVAAKKILGPGLFDSDDENDGDKENKNNGDTKKEKENETMEE